MIAVINDFRLEWRKGYGETKAGTGERVTPETYFQAASTTKLLSAAIALCVVEDSRLDLDEDVNVYLKSWRIPENDLTRDRKVTLRLLLTHQAGLNRPDGGFSCETGNVPSLVQVLEGEAPAQNEAATVEYVPGTAWQYSNLGYVVIQLLLEDLLQRPFTRIAQETVFDPLGMRQSTLVYPLAPELPATEAVPHDTEEMAHRPDMHPTALAQGGLMTTAHDLALFAIELMRAYQGRSNRILSEGLVRRMLCPELDPVLAFPDFPVAQGLGALLYGKGPGFAFLHPGGNDPGATCWLVGYPHVGEGAAIMTNGARGHQLALEIQSAIMKEYDWPAGP